MNLEEQLGALENGVDSLIEAAAHTPAAAPQESAPAAPPEAKAEAAKPMLRIDRPAHNEITMTIGEHTVSLQPQQIGQLIEELSNARASMQPEPPAGLPDGWRYAATRNPVFAVKKQSNGDRLLILRHLGHGWVPYSLSPDAVIQLYMMLTQR